MNQVSKTEVRCIYKCTITICRFSIFEYFFYEHRSIFIKLCVYANFFFVMRQNYYTKKIDSLFTASDFFIQISITYIMRNQNQSMFTYSNEDAGLDDLITKI